MASVFMRQHRVLLRVFSLATLFAFFANTVMALPAPGHMAALSRAFNPAVLRGIKVYPDDPFRFDFILNPGDSALTGQGMKDESSRLVRYFLASLTIPEKDLWVNLSPYEKDRIVPEAFGQTEMGRDLLAQDYLLKQITASAIYPEGEIGKEFWKKVYTLAQEKFGTTDIPVDTFNKVWIVPEKAVLYENRAAGTAYITGSRLKVMLESDHTAMSNNPLPGRSTERPSSTQEISRQILREVVIPVLEKEVNTGENFARLRQAYQSLILAAWYKQKIKDSLLARVYVDRHKISGVSIPDPQEAGKIWARYVEAFRQGVFNYIREDQSPATADTTPRKFFAGGFDAASISTIMDPRGSIVPADSPQDTTLSVLIVKAGNKRSHPSDNAQEDPRSEDQARSLYADIFQRHAHVAWEDLPPISRKVFVWSLGQNDWKSLIRLDHFDAKAFVLRRLPALEHYLVSQQDWVDLFPLLERVTSAFNEQEQDILYEKTLPIFYILFKDQLPLEQILIFADFLMKEIPARDTGTFIDTYMKPHLAASAPIKTEDFIAELARLKEWSRRSYTISGLYPFIGSTLSKEDITTLLASSKIERPVKFKLLTGFCITHPASASQDMYAYFDEFKPLLTLQQIPLLLLAFGQIKTTTVLPCIITLWERFDYEDAYKTMFFTAILRQWPHEVVTALLGSNNIRPSPLLQLMAVTSQQRTFLNTPGDLSRVRFKIASYQEIVESLKLLEEIPDAPAFAPLVDHFFQSIITGIQLSMDHGIPAERTITDIEKLKSIGPSLALFIAHAPGLARACASTLTRLIRRLPMGDRHIQDVKDLADDLVAAIGGGWLGLQGSARFIVDLRDEIHNRINLLTVFKVKAYARYLSTGDQTLLQVTGGAIDDNAPFSKLTLEKNARMTDVNAVLNELIEKMDIIFNGGGTNFMEVINNYNLSIHPLSGARKKDFVSILNPAEALDTLLSRPLNENDTVEGLRLITQLKDALAALRQEERYRDDQLLFLLLDVELETYLYRLLAKIPPDQERRIPTLLAVLHPVIGLGLKSFNVKAQEELHVISDELKQIMDAETAPEARPVNTSPLRVFSIVQRLLRLIRQFSQETTGIYQPVVEYQTQGQKIYKQEKLDDFTADLIRVENPYQLSLTAQWLETALARELHLSWLVARPGTGQGQLIYVKASDDLQQVIDHLTGPAILVTERIPNTTLLNSHVRGCVTREELGVLSHTAIRSDNNAPVVLVQAIGRVYDELITTARTSAGSLFQITAANDQVIFEKIQALDPTTGTSPQTATPVNADLTVRDLITDMNNYKPETVGNKAWSLKRLNDAILDLKTAGQIPDNFDLSIPHNIALPFGYFEHILDENGATGREIRTLRKQLMTDPHEAADKDILNQLQHQIQQLDIDPKMIDTIAALMGDFMMVRLSTSVDDLDKNAAAGIYDSFEQVARHELSAYIKCGYASLYTRTAFNDRHQHQIEENKVHAAVIFQAMAPGNAFRAFSHDPTIQEKEERQRTMSLEVSPGLGKAFEFQGSPHRFRYALTTGAVQRRAYANISYRLVVEDERTHMRLNVYGKDPLSQEEGPAWIKDLFQVLHKIAGDTPVGRDMEGTLMNSNGTCHVFLLQDRGHTSLNTTDAAEGVGKENTGGIDLTTPKLTLESDAPSINTLRLPFSPEQLAQYEASPGFRPVIINAKPTTNLKLFLGVTQ